MTDHAAVHEAITKNTARYLEADPRIGRFASVMDYDPGNIYCNYNTTSFEAKPSSIAGPFIANYVFGMMHRMDRKGAQIESDCTKPLAAQVSKVTRTLRETPLVLINDHDPDLQAGLSAYALGRAISAVDPGNNRANFEAMAAITRLSATRAFAPIEVGHPKVPLVKVPLVALAQLIMTPHFNMPNVDSTKASGITPEFVKQYNSQYRVHFWSALMAKSAHPQGYNDLVSMSPGNTRPVPGRDRDGDEVKVTAQVKPGTIELVKSLGAAVVPVLASFRMHNGEGNFMRLGKIVPPEEITDSTLPNMMADIAFERREHGEAVYYAEESEVA